MAARQPTLRFPHEPHIHAAGERCPACDQPIPNEKAQEIRLRTKARERELAEAATTKAAREFAPVREQIEADAKARVEQALADKTEALRVAAEQGALKEAAARAAGRSEAEADLQDTIAVTAKTAAEWQEKAAAAERERQDAMGERDNVVAARVQEVRDAMEKHEAKALAARDANHFAEMQKLTVKFDEVKRQLDKKTADELGEGAEINLLEILKAEFDGDRFHHVGKGNAGPDIIHTVMHNGRECGCIIYDSKDSKAWRGDWISKLLRDQTAAKADHAVLCVLKLPADEKQIALRDGVIIINPARAVALVHILRKHMVLVHSLRLSKAERAKKMATLYDFITSERCSHLLGRIETHADALLALQEKEVRWHESQWKNEGALLKAIQKVKAELTSEIDCILGTDDPTE